MASSEGFCKKDIDRISNLPEPLISHILSLLPTKCAVATSLLCTSWKSRWTSITSLDLSSGFHLGESVSKEICRDKFTHFVNRVLHKLSSPSIQNFCLKCCLDFFDPCYLNSWISVGLRDTVGEFELTLSRLEENVELPLSNICCNLTILKLYENINFNFPATASVCFPCLQTLHLIDVTCQVASNTCVSFPNLKIMLLSDVHFETEDSVQNLFSSSPVLDDLIIRINDGNIICLAIRIPSLTRISLDVQGCCGYPYKFQLQIDSLAIQYLNLNDETLCEYLPAEKLSSLLEAEVNIYFSDDDDIDDCVSIVKFIGSLSEVKYLSLGAGVLKAIMNASTDISPRFHNLTRLKIEVYDCPGFSFMINNFLESMDNLEHLAMKCHKGRCLHQSWWTESLNVPKCVRSRVTHASFQYKINGCHDQFELLKCFLKNAEVLQLLTISTYGSEKEQLELLKKISLIPRVSRPCQVAFNSCN